MLHKKESLLAIGIMTGNSLDAADVVLTEFARNGVMRDLAFHSLPFPMDLQAELRQIRKVITDANGNMEAAFGMDTFIATSIKRYTEFVAIAVKELLEKAGADYEPDVIGFHGQTCAHNPPSMSGIKENAYTV